MPENEKTLTPQEIAEQRKVAEQKKISSVTAPTTPGATVQGPSVSEQAITKAYDDAIGQTSLLIKELEGRRANAQQQDETAQRKSRNMQMIAGISDGLASLANLIGVGDRGTNIDMGTGALTPLQQKFENARLERKADIKSIDDRLDQYRRQLDQMRMQKGLAVAQQKERERADAKEQSRFNIEMAFRQAESRRQAKERENALAEQTRHNKAQESLTQKEIDMRKSIAEINNQSDILKYTIRYGKSGKDLTQFVMDDPATGQMRTIDISDKSLNNILATYLPVAVKNGEITEEQAEDAKNWRSNEVSKTNLLGMVNSSVTMRKALLTAVGEGVSDDSSSQQPSYTPNQFLYQGSQNGQNEPGWAVKYQ